MVIAQANAGAEACSQSGKRKIELSSWMDKLLDTTERTQASPGKEAAHQSHQGPLQRENRLDVAGAGSAGTEACPTI